MLFALPEALVNANDADAAPLVDATTAYGPATVLAVNGSISWPLLSVKPLIVAAPVLKAPLSPLDGALKVTDTPGTRLPNASCTVATAAASNGVFTIVLCGKLGVATMVAAAAAALVKLNDAGVVVPIVAAVMT